MATVKVIDPTPKAKSLAAPARYVPPADDLDQVFVRPLNHRTALASPVVEDESEKR